MTKLSFRSLPGIVILIALTLSGCSLSHPPSSAAFGFDLSRPVDKSVFPPGSNIPLEIKTRHGNPDLSRTNYEIEVFDNGNQVGDQDYPGNPLVGNFVGDYIIPSESPGVHIIYAKGRILHTSASPSMWYQTDDACIYVGPQPLNINDFCGVPYEQNGQVVEPIQSSPSVTPTPIPVLDSVQANPNPIYYGSTCPSMSTVTFRAAITLPNGVTADQVQVAVHASFIITSPASPSGDLLVPLQPNGTWDASSGGQIFLGTATLTHSYNDANNQFDPASLGGSSGAILWYVTVANNASNQNSQLARSANQVLDLSACPISGQNPHHNSNNGNGPVSGCGQYTNQVSCNLGGCAWNPQNSSCTVNP